MKIRPLLSLLGLLALVTLPAAQGARHVPADHPTIQAAIVAAQPGDLVLVAPGTYNEQLDFLGKAISVVGSAGAENTVLDRTGLHGWLDFPYDPVVRFVNGESGGSVLQGFTITGHDVPFISASAPVWSDGAPTLVGCRIVGNSGGLAGAFYGSGTLSGCTLDGNVSGGEGGGIRGDAQLFDCVISNNVSYGSHGGGIYAWPGLRAVRCRILGNSSALDGHSGGGSYGPAVLEDCLIVGNSGDEFAGQNQEGGAAVEGALLVSGCTITENVFYGNGGYAVRNVQSVVDSIIWNNTQLLGEVSADSSASYSCVEGGAAGIGNLAADPLFVDPGAGDYALQRTSPCVDAGDPDGAPDPDGTVSDLGAFFVPQHAASWTYRFGTDFTPSYSPQTDPVIGTSFLLHVDAPAPTTTTAVLVFTRPSSPIPTPFGELLVDPSSRLVLVDAAPAQGGLGTHDLTLPNDTDLIGRSFASQAAQLGATATLTNAVDFVVGL